MIGYQGISWVRLERYCELSGEPVSTVQDRIRSGQWAAGKHYKRTGERTLWVNQHEVDQWISQQPHIEGVFHRGSRSARAKPESVSA